MHAHGAPAQRRALWWALALNGGFTLVEIAGAIAFGSLVLFADAAHLASDVAGLTVALVAQALATRPASARHSFGLRRAEMVGAQINAVLLLATSGGITVAAVVRLGAPADVNGGGVLVVAALGLIVNVVAALVIARVQGSNLNLRGAALHLAADAVASVGAMVAGIGIVLWNADWLDPVVSIGIAVLVAVAGLRLLAQATSVLLESVPRGFDVDAVEGAITVAPGVASVHHVHVWELGSEAVALSAHVVLDDEPSLHDAQQRGDALKLDLERRFGIAHATLELECHDCDTPRDEMGPGT